MSKPIHVLNLGVGVQSVTLLELFGSGQIKDRNGAPIVLDFSVFADTGDEPAHVYRLLKTLKETNRLGPIIVGQRGILSNGLRNGRNSTGQSFASIPCFTFHKQGPLTLIESRLVAMIRRQCTKEYKLDVIVSEIRKHLGLKKGQRFSKGIRIIQHIGISLDEAGRAIRIRKRFDEIAWAEPSFPLLDINRLWSRADCLKYLLGLDRGYDFIARSACCFCPYHSDAEWLWLKENDASAWAKIIEIDTALRTPGVIVNRNLNNLLFLHRSCLPIDQVDFRDWRNNYILVTPDFEQPELTDFAAECEGMCGA